jgi:hypothetical protein
MISKGSRVARASFKGQKIFRGFQIQKTLCIIQSQKK